MNLKKRVELILTLSDGIDLGDLEAWKRVKDCDHEIIKDWCFGCGCSESYINELNKTFGGEE